MHETYEEVTPGETMSFGSYDVSREEIRSFAQAYDPQPFHLDDVPDSMFDGIVASGWHTAAMTMRMFVDNYLRDSGALGSPGLDGLRWLKPVYPGDTLSVRVTFGETEPWDDDRGLVHVETETHNGDGETVMWMDARVLYRRGNENNEQATGRV